jgi:hypothetical protein
MPLLARPAPVVAPPVQTERPKVVVWTSAAGDEIPLSAASGYVNLPGRAGLGLPPTNVVYDALPDGGGSLRTIQDLVRVITLPLRVQGATAAQYLARLNRLQASFRHPVRSGLAQPGTLTVRLPDGSARSIAAYYHGGLDAPEDTIDDLIQLYQNFPNLELLALDPTWTGGSVGGRWGDITPPVFFGTMPRTLAPSQVLGSVTVDLPGDADSWPVWTITGPGTPTVTNLTSGRSWQFASAISAGRTVTVDTRPDKLTVVDDLGADLYGSLDTYPDLWPLEPGLNDLTVEVASSTSASAIAFTADVRWRSGW